MKAKEYIAKYRETLNSCDISPIEKAKAVTNMYIEFSKEAGEICEARGVKRNSALVAVLREQNDKWNCVAREFPGMIAKDGFKNQWLHDMPELRSIWR